jgi:hypothetical protein
MSATRLPRSGRLSTMNCDRRTPDEILLVLAQRNIDAIDREIRAANAELEARERQLSALNERRCEIARRLASIKASLPESS